MEIEFSRHVFRKTVKYQISWKCVRREPICSMWTERRIDRRTTRKIIIAFCSFMNAPRKLVVTDGVRPWTKGITELDDIWCQCVPVCTCCLSHWKFLKNVLMTIVLNCNIRLIVIRLGCWSKISVTIFRQKKNIWFILGGDILLCLSIILKWNEIYTSSDTTILCLIDINNSIIYINKV